MIASIGLSSTTTDYRQNSRQAEQPAVAAQSREERDRKVSAAVASGVSGKELEALVAAAVINRYSEEELVADEERINAREALKARLREGISDPEEALKVKAMLVMAKGRSDDRALDFVRRLEAAGELDEIISDELARPRMPSLRETQSRFRPVSVEELKNQNSTWTPDLEIWKPGPDGVGWVFRLSRQEMIDRGILIEPTPEIKAEVAVRKANVAGELAELRKQAETNPDIYAPVVKNNAIREPDVATLLKQDIAPRMNYISLLVRSGEADKYPFEASYGDRKTNSATEYLFWLQKRAMELEEDGTYMPGMFRGHERLRVVSE